MNDTEQLKAIIQRAGLKATHQRLEILREMKAARDHPSAEEIYERIRPRIPTVSLDTVYRTLATFEETGVIARLHVCDGRIRYDPDQQRHDHFVCLECRKVIDCHVPGADTLRVPQEAKQWGDLASVHVELRGICKNCLKKKHGRRRT